MALRIVMNFRMQATKATFFSFFVNVFRFLKPSGLPNRMSVMIILGASVIPAIGFR
jgi:hypothetical protein